jgi:hypothetical protein
MNEVEWLTGQDPQAMLSYLGGKVSERRLRLFACACCRRFWPQLRDARARQAVEVSERYAEGQANDVDLAEARERAQLAEMDAPLFEAYAYQAATAAAGEDATRAAHDVLRLLRQQAGRDEAYAGVPGIDEQRAYAEGVAAESRAQSDLIRTFFGNPFRPVRIDPDWLRSGDGAVLKLARVIYDHDQYEDLPFLADALMDAGCTDDFLLRDCRRPGRSVGRGGQHGRRGPVISAFPTIPRGCASRTPPFCARSACPWTRRWRRGTSPWRRTWPWKSFPAMTSLPRSSRR